MGTVNGALGTVTIALSLVLAGWSGIAALRNRPPDRSHLVGLAVLTAAVLVVAVDIVIAVAGGAAPAEAGTFWGYLATLVCLPPLAAVLARMEPTRWGTVIVLVVCLVIPVVVVRLQQTWEVAGV
ncbi:MAG TPA: hypothetical protein VFX61_02915 [Micromonosporaceae bacterium]|nr:hypothetical protein [Micromonosporaceae bacterium]